MEKTYEKEACYRDVHRACDAFLREREHGYAKANDAYKAMSKKATQAHYGKKQNKTNTK